MRVFIIALTLAALTGGLGMAAYASYQGVGLIASGAPWIRVGSIGGPAVQGGGPGSGK